MAKQEFRSLYPDYDVLAKWDTPSWNEQTRAVVAKRLNQVPSREFFDELQYETLEAVCDRVVRVLRRDEPADERALARCQVEE